MADSARNTVQSVAKAFSVLRAFDAEHPELIIAEVAGRTGLDRGNAFRLIRTLVSLGYLAPVPNSRRFRLTFKCLELGYSALTREGLRAPAAPLLRGLVPDHADAASLGVLEGADVVYVERVQVDLARRALDRRVGSCRGAYAAALGHAILAWYPPEQGRAVLAPAERVPLSGPALVDLDALSDRLASVRATGYAVSDREDASGLRMVAAPVLGPDGRPLAGVGLTVRSERWELDSFVAHAVPELLQTAQQLTEAARLTGASA